MIKKFLKKENILIFIIYILSLFWLSQKILNEISNKKIQIVLLGVAILSTIAMFFLFYILEKKYNEHKTFFIVGLTIGLLYTIFIPAIQGATDELPHILRTYQITAGDIIVKNPDNNETEMPEELYNFSQYLVSLNIRYSKENLFKSVDYNNKVNINNVDVATGNSPILYIPQIIGMEISKIAHLSPVMTLMLVRLCNFIIWLLLTTQAIKLFPIHKKTLSIFFIAPAVLSLVCTTNMDALPLATITLFFAYIFKYKYTEEKIVNKDKIILLILSLIFSTYKLFYPLLLITITFIPEKCFKNKKDKNIFVIIILLLSLGLDFLWYKLSMSASSIVGNTLGAEQMNLILKRPIYYCYVLLNTYLNNFYYYITNLFAGSEMCYQYAEIPSIFIISYIVLFIYTLFNSEKNNINFKKKEIAIILIMFFTIIVLASTSLYIGWTVKLAGVGHDEILGIQSRYYFAFVPLFVLLYKNKKRKFNNVVFKYIIMLNMIMLITTITSVVIGIMKLV